jgi:RNA polymerase subunit RPABC4/transcription elongation factor Spt4
VHCKNCDADYGRCPECGGSSLKEIGWIEN